MRRVATVLIVCMLVLIALGIVMLFSVSSVKGNIPFFYLKRQLQWLCVAVVAGVVVAKIDYHFWREIAPALYVGAVLLLLAVFVPGIGATVKGSTRWISLGGIRIQVSEIAKFVMIVCMASWMAHYVRQATDFKVGFFWPLMILGGIALPVFKEPDFGTTAVVSVVGMAIMYVAGTRLINLLGALVFGAAAFSWEIMHNPNRLARMMSFLYPDKYPDKAYHMQQSLIAFMLGGPFGVGLGNSMQKRLYLPEAHTDFIFSIIGEEMGFVAAIFVVVVYVTFFICGIAISLKASDTFGRLLGFGITLMITGQAAFNIGVVTGVLPTKGLALPFISYGGSSLVMAVVMSCVLLSISQHSDGTNNGA